MQFVKDGPDVPEQLLQAHEDGQVVFFCGAGISYPAALPGFGKLVEQLFSHLGHVPDAVQAAALKAKRYDTVVGLLEGELAGGRRIVREAIAKILAPDTSKPRATATHEALLELAKCQTGRKRLITTNFDRLFEHVIAERNLAIKRFEAPLLPTPKQRWDGLVYLHGLLPENSADNDLNDLVISSGDFGLAYLTERWAARFVSELLRNFIVCFVGYSIDDPILRYMMDALAADKQLGESQPDMFAFGSYSKGKETELSNEWRAKNVTPILYWDHQHHAYLHRTLQAWADTYRNGVGGKERIVTEYAMARPDTATRQDDIVSRVLWALSDPSGLPAKRFADHNPVPSLAWLAPFSENRFGHADLIRFGVPPKVKVDENLVFSLTRRPAPYDLSPQMMLASSGTHEACLDDVMWHLTRWLTRHLNDPTLLLWLVKQGGRLHPKLVTQLRSRLSQPVELEQNDEQDKLDMIRDDAPDAIPNERMRKLWDIFLSGRVEVHESDMDLCEWCIRFSRDGLTTALRLELREMLSPRVSMRDPFRWSLDDVDEQEEPGHMKQLVDWDIVLSTSDVHGTLDELRGNKNWKSALPTLLADFTGLLRDALDLMCELEGADDKSDWSYINQPSISDHKQNLHLNDWTALIELNKDAWQAMVAVSPEKAQFAASSWSRIPYPLFRRLAFFAAAQPGVIPRTMGLEWLLADNNWWLWSVETQRETMRLLVALTPQLDKVELARIELAILAGPPRQMFRADIKEEGWTRIREQTVWLRLAKISQAGAALNATALGRLNELSSKYRDWQLSDDEREEFASWSGDVDDLSEHIKLPRDKHKLLEWLRQNPELDMWHTDDWCDRCREDFDDAAWVLTTLAEEEIWPTERWRAALQVWSAEELRDRAWSKIAPVLANLPREAGSDLYRGVSWWLKALAKTFEGQETAFLSLCDRVLEMDDDVEEEEEEDDPVGRAINHPIGHVTEALLQWWYRGELKDGQGLAQEPRLRFTQLCNTGIPKFRHGRVLLATHVISLFRVDRGWTLEYVLPLFNWKDSALEARSAWEGFLWSPRIYRPLMEKLTPTFLDTVDHYDQLSKHGRQFASLLTFVGLDQGDLIRNRELAPAMLRLPQTALDHAANTLFLAVDSAGDQRADYWRNRADPYLRSIWPKSSDRKSLKVTESFARVCIAAGDAFPEALQRVKPWLQPLHYPNRIALTLHNAELDGLLPKSALELLDQIVGDSAQGSFPHLKKCLESIRTAAPELELDHRFQRLVKILRANGEDLN